jgi:hypothetical protein
MSTPLKLQLRVSDPGSVIAPYIQIYEEHLKEARLSRRIVGTVSRSPSISGNGSARKDAHRRASTMLSSAGSYRNIACAAPALAPYRLGSMRIERRSIICFAFSALWALSLVRLRMISRAN